LAEPKHAAQPSRGPEGEWDAALYLQFEAERTQPARDLLARLHGWPRRVVDLGCGPGTSTRLIVERFPEAEVVGVDNSAAMLAEARRGLPGVRFERADIAEWAPDEAPDLIFANDSLQWLPDHERLFARLIAALAPGGALAVQMPDTRHEPSHALMRLIAADGPWTDRLVPIAKTSTVIATHIDYLGWLKPHCAAVDIWQTTYMHLMAGVGAVVDWFRGAALRPFLAPLATHERALFLDRYQRELADAYDADPDGGLVFLYPRLFIHARKGARR
jgi:trans-aconitate 2-methyltransferase